MADLTDYYADFELTTLVRRAEFASGKEWCEPLWFKSGCESGLAVFVSALDAEIYRLAAAKQGHIGWERLPLSNFDLLAHIKEMGGSLSCRIVFGFGASLSRELSAGTSGAPRPLLVPALFEVGPAADRPISFQFEAWIFEFMRQQWSLIGPEDYPAQVEAMNTSCDSELSQAAAQAINSIVLHEATDTDHDWCLFSPSTASWHFGPTELRQAQHIH